MGEVSFFKEKLKELGKWEAAEKRMLCILLALTVYLFTSRWHGLGMVYGFVAALALAFVPGMELGDKSDLGKINWGAWLFVGACTVSYTYLDVYKRQLQDNLPLFGRWDIIDSKVTMFLLKTMQRERGGGMKANEPKKDREEVWTEILRYKKDYIDFVGERNEWDTTSKYTVKELAKLIEISEHTVRYYDKAVSYTHLDVYKRQGV